MTPLGLVVAGLGVVVMDFRLDGFDLLPDVLGWVVVLTGLARLAGRSAWFAGAAVAAGCGVLLGTVLLVIQPGPLVTAVETVVLGGIVVGTLTGIRQLVDDPRARTTADRLRWTNLALMVAGLLTLVLGEPTQVTGAAGALVVLVVVVAFAAFGWFLVFMWTHRRQPALVASGARRDAGSLHG